MDRWEWLPNYAFTLCTWCEECTKIVILGHTDWWVESGNIGEVWIQLEFCPTEKVETELAINADKRTVQMKSTQKGRAM